MHMQYQQLNSTGSSSPKDIKKPNDNDNIIYHTLHTNGCLEIILNRVKALNALNYDMVKYMFNLLF